MESPRRTPIQPSSGRRGKTPTIRRSDAPRCQLLFGNRLLASIMMALPFVFCFTLFGIFNLIAGSVLTAMAWKPRTLALQNSLFSEDFMKEHSHRIDTLLDPLKIIGPILLITGAMLILVGIALGVTACRSAHTRRSSFRNPGNNSAVHLSTSNGPLNYSAVPGNSFRQRGTSLSLPEHTPKRSPSSSTRVTIEVHVPPVASCTLQCPGLEDAKRKEHRVLVIRDTKETECACGTAKSERPPVIFELVRPTRSRYRTGCVEMQTRTHSEHEGLLASSAVNEPCERLSGDQGNETRETCSVSVQDLAGVVSNESSRETNGWTI